LKAAGLKPIFLSPKTANFSPKNTAQGAPFVHLVKDGFARNSPSKNLKAKKMRGAAEANSYFYLYFWSAKSNGYEKIPPSAERCIVVARHVCRPKF
jgi:hypothetical protein